MLQQNYNKQQAFSLMELLLVLLVMVAVILIGRSQYEKYVLRKDIAVVEQNLQLLFDQLDKSFNELSDTEKVNCASRINNNIIPDWSQILHSNLIPDITVGTITHPNFTVSCINPGFGQPAQLVITAPLNVKSDQMDWYAQRLNGFLEGDKVKWTKVFNYMFAGKDPYWILGGQLEQFKEKMSFSAANFMVNFTSAVNTYNASPLYIVIKGVGNENKNFEFEAPVNTAIQKKFSLFLAANNTLSISKIEIYCAKNRNIKIWSLDNSALNNLPATEDNPLIIYLSVDQYFQPPGEDYYYKAKYGDNAGHSNIYFNPYSAVLWACF